MRLWFKSKRAKRHEADLHRLCEVAGLSFGMVGPDDVDEAVHRIERLREQKADLAIELESVRTDLESTREHDEKLRAYVIEHEGKLSPAEAVMGIMVWLSRAQEPRTFWRDRDAAEAAKLARKFCDVHGLGVCRASWPEGLLTEVEGTKYVPAE